MSITKKREFAAVNIRKGELRLGMDLGELPCNGWVEKAKLMGAMPRISHMVIVRKITDINNQLVHLLDTASKRVNP